MIEFCYYLATLCSSWCPLVGYFVLAVVVSIAVVHLCLCGDFFFWCFSLALSFSNTLWLLTYRGGRFVLALVVTQLSRHVMITLYLLYSLQTHQKEFATLLAYAKSAF